MASKRVAFFDLGRKTGVAHDGHVPGVPITQLWILPGIEGNSEEGREFGPQYAALRARIAGLITILKPDAIGFEAAINVMGHDTPAQRGKTNPTTIRSLFGLAAVTEEVASSLGIPCYESHLSTIKKYITGNGRAEKPEVLAAVKRLGWDAGENYDRADAAAGWSHLKSLIEPTFSPKTTPLFARGAA